MNYLRNMSVFILWEHKLKNAYWQALTCKYYNIWFQSKSFLICLDLRTAYLKINIYITVKNRITFSSSRFTKNHYYYLNKIPFTFQVNKKIGHIHNLLKKIHIVVNPIFYYNISILSEISFISIVIFQLKGNFKIFEIFVLLLLKYPID